MRSTKILLAGLAVCLTAGGAALAAPAVVREPDCQKFGGEVSALIDSAAGSSNLAVARATFQRGIMACMEGDDAAANSLYRNAKTLLSGEEEPAPSRPVTATSEAIEADCQKLGGEVSALIDKSVGLPNLPAARATFQRGIMDCMEGDDAEANKLYQEAKKLLDTRK